MRSITWGIDDVTADHAGLTREAIIHNRTHVKNAEKREINKRDNQFGPTIQPYYAEFKEV